MSKASYVRKTRDYWAIEGYYAPLGWEEVSAYDSRAEARQDLVEYHKSSRGLTAFRIVKKREAIASVG